MLSAIIITGVIWLREDHQFLTKISDYVDIAASRVLNDQGPNDVDDINNSGRRYARFEDSQDGNSRIEDDQEVHGRRRSGRGAQMSES